MSNKPPQLDNPDDIKHPDPEEKRLSLVIHIIRHCCDISDHEIPLKIVRNSFFASDAIDVLLEKEIIKCREEGVVLGELLIKKHIILPVQNTMQFKDKRILYRFFCDQDERHLSDYPLTKDIISKWRFNSHTVLNSLVLDIPLVEDLYNSFENKDNTEYMNVFNRLRGNIYTELSSDNTKWIKHKEYSDGQTQHNVYRTLKQGDYSCYKYTTVVPISLTNLLKSFDNPSNYKEWMPWIEGYYTIQRIKGPSALSYNETKDSNDKTHNNNIDDNNDNKNNGVGMSSVQLMYLWCKNKGLGSTGRDLSILEDKFCIGRDKFCHYFISVEQIDTPIIKQYIRGEILLHAYLFEEIGENSCRITLISQVNMIGSFKKWMPKKYSHLKLIIPPSLYCFAVISPNKNLKNKDELKFPSLEFIKDGNISLKDFNIRKEIGRGGFGRVFMVQCKLNNKYYAMKVISKEYIRKKRQILRTKQEKKLLSTLRHPFIVSLKCTFQSTPALYIVMELVQGGDLFLHLSKYGVFSESRARFYLVEIILALEYIHSNNIIYRDLKPENVLINKDGHIKIIDFGLSRWFKDPDTTDFSTHSFCGTEQYMAPEVLLRKGHSYQIDWWCLGIMMCEMITGEHPFIGKTHHDTLRNIVKTSIVPEIHGMSPIAKDLARKLLQKDPSRRLGVRGNVQEIKDHPFFNGIDWNLFLRKEKTPPYIPSLTTKEDSRYFSLYMSEDKIPDIKTDPLLVQEEYVVKEGDEFPDFGCFYQYSTSEN